MINKLIKLLAIWLIYCSLVYSQEIQPIQRGTLASRPATPAHGRLYMVTDSGSERLTYFNGLSWQDVLINSAYLTGTLGATSCAGLSDEAPSCSIDATTTAN